MTFHAAQIQPSLRASRTALPLAALPATVMLISSCGGVRVQAESERVEVLGPAPPVTARATSPCPPGLEAWWRFDEAAGSVVDACGRHAGTVGGAGVVRGVPGQVGTAIRFEGAGGFVVVEGSPRLDLIESVTIELWFRAPRPTPQGVQGGRPIVWPVGEIIGRGTGSMDDCWFVDTNCANIVVAFQRADGSGVATFATDCELIPDERWVHLTVVNDGTRLRLYLDGVLVREVEGGRLGPVRGDLFIGRRVQGLFPLVGTIDELRLWTVALSEADIRAHAADRL